MSIWTVALLLVCLGHLCLGDRVRILASPHGQESHSDLTAQGAFKSRIRSLTLKSALERAIPELIAQGSHQSKSSKRIPPKNPFTDDDDGDTYQDTTKPTGTSIATTKSTVITPTPCPCPSSEKFCFCIQACEGCGCKSSSPAPQPIPCPTPGCSTPAPVYPTQPIQPTQPYPQPTSKPCGGGTPSSQSGCCVIPVVIPCYVCPCISPCSLVPYQDCPCTVEPGEYQCPNFQPYPASPSELSYKIDQGYRIVDTLRTAPSCAYNPSGGQYAASGSNGNLQLNPSRQWPPSNAQSESLQLNLQPQWPPTQINAGEVNSIPNSNAQVQFPFGAINFKTESQQQSQAEQPSHFLAVGSQQAEDLSQSQPSSYYRYRGQRQRPNPGSQGVFKNYQQGGQQQSYQYPNGYLQPYSGPGPQPGSHQPYVVSPTGSYPVPGPQPQPGPQPGPIPYPYPHGYPQPGPIPYQPYAVPPSSSYPAAPTEQPYVVPTTTQPSATTQSSASGRIIPLSILMASLTTLMLTMGICS